MSPRLLLACALLVVAFYSAHIVPKPKYASTDILSKIAMPETMLGWQSRDISGKLNLQDDRYKFVSKVFARVYKNESGQDILFLVLDAGNFHHPKTCFGSSGFAIEELPDVVFQIDRRNVQVNALLSSRKDEAFLVLYWMIINGKRVNWVGQKMNQLWYSLVNKPKTGLMMRIDLPLRGLKAEAGITASEKFLQEIGAGLSEEAKTAIFGQPAP